MFLKNWSLRVRALGVAAAAALVSCTSVSYAEPDYDIIGKQFSLVLQNAHFSRARFSQEMYQYSWSAMCRRWICSICS